MAEYCAGGVARGSQGASGGAAEGGEVQVDLLKSLGMVCKWGPKSDPLVICVCMRRLAAEVAEQRWQAELDEYDGLSAVLADVRFGLADGRDGWLVAYAAFARRRRGQLFLLRPLSEAAAWHGWCGRWPTLPRFPD